MQQSLDIFLYFVSHNILKYDNQNDLYLHIHLLLECLILKSTIFFSKLNYLFKSFQYPLDFHQLKTN